jgi:cation diffusion facilitator family transporter
VSHQHLTRPVLLAIAAAVVTLGLKFAAWWLTGSAGLLSDAAESVVNLVAALTAYFSLRYAARPVDVSHTYGHEKIEFFSSGIEGSLILVAAVGIIFYALRGLVRGVELQALDLGLLIGTVASVINLVVAQVLLRVGRAYRSIVLEADGKHLMTDVWTSVAVLVGLGLVTLTGLQWLDPLIALGVAGNIVWTGVGLVRRSFDGLMDHALSPDEVAAARTAIEATLPPGTTYHALRTRQAGARRFLDFHLLVPGIYTVRRAHEIGDAVEEALRTALPGAEITVHIEPIEDPEAWGDSALLLIEEASGVLQLRPLEDPPLPVQPRPDEAGGPPPP